jgi:hypothetical protein
METSGRPTEGWMTVVPFTVFVFIVMFALGGPTAFMNIVINWASDLVHYVLHWLKSL